MPLNSDQRGETGPNGKPSLTVEEAAENLIRTGASWSAVRGQGTALTYSFRTISPSDMPSDTGGFSPFIEAQMAATRRSLLAWSDVANITFQEVDDLAGPVPVMRFANFTTGEAGAAAFAYYPGSRARGAAEGDVWVRYPSESNVDLGRGGSGDFNLVHEIGHALGLAHPGDYNADSTVEYDTHATYFEDSRIYSVMSYFGSINAGVTTGIFANAPQMDDVFAVQLLYGANTTTRTGDTVYGFNSNTDRTWYTLTAATDQMYVAIWDAGGVDTLDFSGYAQNQRIDLTTGAFSDVGPNIGSVGIALGVTIENAIGGAGGDSIIGNTTANVLSGGAGTDTLEGRGGSDQLNGDPGADILRGGAGDDLLLGGADSDVLDGEAGVDIADFRDQTAAVVLTLAGATIATALIGNVASDTVVNVERVLGGMANDVLTGDAADNQLDGRSGNDVLKGGSGLDFLLGGAGLDVADYRDKTVEVGVTLKAAANAVVFVAGVVEDALRDVEAVYGGSAADRLIGDARTNLFRGGGGADVIDGGPGVDAVDFRELSVKVLLALAGSTEAVASIGGVLEDRIRNVEQVYGGTANDILVGDAEANLLVGGGGADTLRGMTGADTLTGGAGTDLFVFNTLAESEVSAPDTISDFQSGADDIRLVLMDADRTQPGDQAFVLGDLAAGAAGRLQVSADGAGRWLVRGDVNADGVADFAIAVLSPTAPGADDFVL